MTPQFLYPTSRQFPFDEVCEQIVRALADRAFKVPGLVVEYHDYGSGAQKLRHVSVIKSDQSAIDLGWHDVKIRFGRPQGLLPGGRFNDCAAVSEVQLAKRALHVYEDESGPTYDIYVGDDWGRDRSTWWSTLNARLNKKPRLCVHYKGAYPRYRGQRSERLVAEDDHREYTPEGDEPVEFDTAAIMEEFRRYLQGTILPAITEFPVVAPVPPIVESPVPMPADAGPFFAYAEGRDVRRIELGKTKIDDLALADRYGLRGSPRLAHLSLKSGPDLPEVAYDGFLWCSPIATAEGWKVPGYMRGSYDDYLVKVTPKDARGVYVADHAVYEKVRAKLCKEIAGTRDRLTDEEVNLFLRARACTIVPFVDYKGNYEDPVYLINRELSFDEVEVIGKA